MGTKKCTKCKNIKNVNEFYKNNSYKDGLTYYCKSCFYSLSRKWINNNREKVSEIKNNWADNNREKLRLSSRKWAAKNREKNIETTKNWRKINIERCKTYRTRYRNDNYEKINQYRRRWSNNNPEKIKSYIAKRCNIRSDKYNAWKKQYILSLPMSIVARNNNISLSILYNNPILYESLKTLTLIKREIRKCK